MKDVPVDAVIIGMWTWWMCWENRFSAPNNKTRNKSEIRMSKSEEIKNDECRNPD